MFAICGAQFVQKTVNSSMTQHLVESEHSAETRRLVTIQPGACTMLARWYLRIRPPPAVQRLEPPLGLGLQAASEVNDYHQA
jgi:hypothetical protein